MSLDDDYPSCLRLYRSGELARRVETALASLADCTVCPRDCHVDRLHDDARQALCRTGRYARVGSHFPHFGEEDCLRGTLGSGTIFFSYCNLKCVFCQNFDLSWEGQGSPTKPDELARLMLELQQRGCHNINFVTPEHVVPQLLEGLYQAVERGLRLPIVYNTSSYDSLESLRLLDGVIDIYMPDFKFWDEDTSKWIMKAKDYPEVARRTVKEMHRQVGDLTFHENGLARRGLLVRHLVMPNGLAGTREIMRFLSRELSPNTYVNIMDQYRPAGRAERYDGINRPLLRREHEEAIRIAREEGLWRFDERRPGRRLALL
ncbi:MAG: radical SAM protein [Planctomycetia bacterium]|nr:radical SAM protein [Planctomycetia bacterium]